jgi:alkanesulfonate monooxygenase SsuD/methylene tetrahydromethanopterin reductase-like flavin-dependent oxidoreductase (luciferase family)
MLERMRFGLALPQYGFSLPSGRIAVGDAVAWARRAEELGFDSVWLSDHFFYSFGRYGADPAPIAALEPLTALGGIAAATTRVRLGVIVLAVGFRPPAVVAKAATTIDRISGGRVDLGLGAGWLEDEYVAFGYPFGSVGERFDALERVLREIGRLLTDRSAPGPRPVQEPIPIWVGGKGGPRLLRLAARHAAGWNAVWRVSPEAHAGAVADVARACAREGRDPATMRRSVGLYGTIGVTEDEARERFERARASFPGDAMQDDTWETWRADTLSGSPEQVIERVQAFAALGVEELILSPWALPFAVPEPEIVDVFASEVIPACR